MSSRPLLTPYAVITDGDMSGDIISEVTVIRMNTLVAYGVSWSGSTPIGEITVEVSNDYELDAGGGVKNAGTWNELPLSNPCPVTGNTGNGFIDIFATSAFAIRLKYSRGSGTGTMQATLTGKVA